MDFASGGLAGELFAGVEGLGTASEIELLVRRFLDCASGLVGEDKSVWEVLFTSFADAREVLDLLPIPFSRALNFLLVTFMVREGSSERVELDLFCRSKCEAQVVVAFLEINWSSLKLNAG